MVSFLAFWRHRSFSRAVWFALALAAAGPAWAGWTGAGFLDGGLRGDYYPSATLPDAGTTATFSRTDVRIAFDWGSTMPVGGSRDPVFLNFPRENFSVRWTGRIVARFSETYTFATTANDGARLYLRPAGTASWTTVIDNWPGAGQPTTTVTGDYALTAEAPYDIMVEYRQLTDTAVMVLKWSSASQELEVVEPAAYVGMNYGTYEEQMFADAFKDGRTHYEGIDSNPAPSSDANGWPQGNFAFIVSEMLYPYHPSVIEIGTMRLTFTGRATVTVSGNGVLVGGSTSYDAGSNTTTLLIQGQDRGSNILGLNFRATDRDGNYGSDSLPDNDGVTNIRFMRPSAPNSATPIAEGTLLYPKWREAMERLTEVRFQRTNDQARVWSERTQPGGAFYGRSLPYVYNSKYGGGQWNLYGSCGLPHEVEIMTCNELGCDYYVSVPHLADVGSASSYFQNLARLVRYGSDSTGTPYTGPTADPYFPPLNPNLNCYVEIANELWNFAQVGSYAPYYDYRELIETKANANDADFQVLNFDNLTLTLDGAGYHTSNYTWVRRYWALKLKQISDDFRTVWGDAEMPGGANAQPRIRPYYTWQYADANASGSTGLNFMDNYFGNMVGSFVATPRPSSYYFWCAGGAGYYSSSNKDGFVTPNPVTDAGFETHTVSTFELRPTGGGWTFGNNAGIAAKAVRNPVMTAATPGTSVNNRSDWVGCKFTVGATPIAIYELGRWVSSGNTGTHSVRIVQASNSTTVASASVAATGTSGQFVYARCVATTLQANTTYYLLSQETNGGDSLGDSTGTVTPGASITVGAPATATLSGTTWAFTDGSGANRCWGPVNFKFAPVEVLASGTPLNPPDPMQGNQCAWLQNVGGVQARADVTFSVPATQSDNHYALSFRWTQRNKYYEGTPDTAAFKIFAVVDGTTTTITPLDTATQPQQWNAANEWKRINWWVGDYFFSECFTAPAGAAVTVRFEGNNPSGDQVAFLDNVLLTSADAFYAGDIPSTGAAMGQTAGTYLGNMQGDSKLCAAYDLRQMTYEHGYSAGGDAGNSAMQNYCKFLAPAARQTVIDAMRIMQQAGGFLPTLGTYSTWPANEAIAGVRVEGVLDSASYPLTQGIDDMLGRIAYAPTFGYPVPSAIPGTSYTLNVTSPRYRSYNLAVTQPRSYAVGVDATAGGTVELSLGGSTVIATGATGSIVSGNIYLPYGSHAIRARTVSGSFTINRILIDAATQAPAAPSGVVATVAGVAVSLAWTDNSNGPSQELWFDLERATDVAFTQNLTQIRIAADSTAWTDPAQLPVNTRYYYRIRAYNLAGTSAWADANDGAGIFVPVPPASHTLFAYEPFDVAPRALQGTSDGSGWNGAWTVQNGDTVSPGFQVENATTMTYPTLKTRGTSYGTGGRAYLTAGRTFDLTGVPYYFKRSVSGATQLGADGTALWLAALVRVDKAGTTGNFLIVSSNTNPPDGSSHKAGTVISGNKWALRARDAANAWTTVETTRTVTLGQTVLAALKFEFGTEDTVSLFLDPPTTATAELAQPDARIATAGDLFFRALAFYPDESPQQGSLDEVRFGDSFFAVVPPPNRPPAFLADPVVAPDAPMNLAYSASIASQAADPDLSDKPTFSKIDSGIAWLTVGTDGHLSGTPTPADLGLSTCTLRVTDADGLFAEAVLQVTVVEGNHAPTFATDPFAMPGAVATLPYAQTIGARASDRDAGDTLTFSKTSGPAWLVIAANGALSGTPGTANVGVNPFGVHVQDGAGAGADATMTVRVAPPPPPIPVSVTVH